MALPRLRGQPLRLDLDLGGVRGPCEVCRPQTGLLS